MISNVWESKIINIFFLFNIKVLEVLKTIYNEVKCHTDGRGVRKLSRIIWTTPK